MPVSATQGNTAALPTSSHANPIDTFAQAEALEAELRRTIQGEVRFDRGTRALYATDASNYRQVPIGVVVPRHDDDVRAVVAASRSFGAPILARGAGTSLAGQSCNVAVVLDFTKYMNRIVELDPDNRTCARAAWRGAGYPARARRTARPDVRSRSLDAQPLQPWRHDRQQLLRHALAARREDRRQRVPAADSALRRHGADRGIDLGRRARRHRARRRPPRADLCRSAIHPRPVRPADSQQVSATPPARVGLQPGSTAA